MIALVIWLVALYSLFKLHDLSKAAKESEARIDRLSRRIAEIELIFLMGKSEQEEYQ